MKSIEYKSRMLYKFLKRHGCLMKYQHNIILRHGDMSSEVGRNVLTHQNGILYLIEYFGANIDASFTWSQTEEGHEYWQRLNFKFGEELKDSLNIMPMSYATPLPRK